MWCQTKYVHLALQTAKGEGRRTDNAQQQANYLLDYPYQKCDDVDLADALKALSELRTRTSHHLFAGQISPGLSVPDVTIPFSCGVVREEEQRSLD